MSKVRVLDFSGEEGEKRYSVVYDGIIFAKKGFVAAENRVIGKALDKLEAIGESKKAQGDQTTFRLNPEWEGRVVTLSEGEFTIILEAIDSVEWTPSGSRAYNAVRDWLDTIESTTVKDKE